MSDESSKTPFGLMNRRKMLGTTTALVGGAVAGVAGSAFGQEKPKAARAPAAAPATGPNLNPPVLQLEVRKAPRPQGGQDLLLPGHPLRGSRAFRTAQGGSAVGRREERAGVGPGLPEPGTDHRQLR